MSKRASGREDWDMTMAQTGDLPTVAKKNKRFSGRIRSLTKTVRVVDEETRREARDLRLESLEADNYGDTFGGDGDASDDAYDVESDLDIGLPSTSRARKQETKSQSRAASSSAAVAFSGRAKPLSFYTSDLPTVNEDGSPAVNYLTAVSAPSQVPARKTCSVCGFAGGYTCSRCGSRFCTISCQSVHKETKCVRF